MAIRLAAFSASYTVDVATEPFPVPLTPINPRGSLVYGNSITAAILSAGDTDNYTLALDAGQTLSAFVNPVAGLQPILTITGPGGITLGAATATAAGNQVFLQSLPVSSAGTYTLAVASASGTGNYTLQADLNGDVEEEPLNGVSNQMSIDNSRLSLPQPRYAVVGTSTPTLATTSGEISTMFAENNGQNGNMFDVTTFAKPVTITSLDVNIAPGTYTMVLYIKSGTYVGFDTTASAWTEIATATITSAGADLPTSFVVPAFQLAANSVTGFYVTSTTGEILYTNGSSTYSNSDLSLTLGIGKSYPFGSTFSPRIWNGNIHYTVGTGTGTPDVDKYTVNLAGEVGHHVDIVLAGQQGVSFAGEQLQLLGTDGSTVLATGVSNPLGVTASNYDLGILDFVVPTSGVYTVCLTSTLTQGTYAILVTDSLSFDSEPNNLPTNALRSLDQTQAALGYLSSSDTDMYAVDLTAGESITATTATPLDGSSGQPGDGLDPNLVLYDPTGRQVAADANSLDGKNARIQYVAASSGTYKIAIAATSGAGQYMVQVAEDHPPTATVSLSSHAPLTNDVLTATASKADIDGNPVSLTFVWSVNGVVKRTYSSASALTDTFDLSVPGNGDTGDVIVVSVTPNDGTLNGATVTDTATVTGPAVPTIAWSTPAAIVYGTLLGSSQLDATASALVDGQIVNVPGTFTYTPLAGTLLAAGTQTLNVSFLPTDTTDYTPATGSTTLIVSPAPLTVSGITAGDKVYDNTTIATLNTASAALAGVLSGDSVTLGVSGASGAFVSKNAANGIAVTIAGLTLGGPQANDYTLLPPTATANIAARPITVSAATDTKNYDGTTSTTATPAITAGSLAPGDTAAISETFDTPAVGTGKTLTPAGSVNDGNSGNNYAVTFAVDTSGQIASWVATTTTVTTSQASVVYGTAVTITATVAPTSGTTAPSLGSVDFVDLTTSTDLGPGTFADSTNGTNPFSTWTLTTAAKTFNVTAADVIRATYSSSIGFGAGSGTVSQTVTPLAITVTAATSSKTYDGTTSTTATPAITGGSLVAGDTAILSETFDTRNVGTGKTLTAAGSVNDGNSGSNYTVSFVTDTTGSIAPLAITVTAAAATKVYDGTTTATATPFITSGALITGDTAAWTETFDTRNAGAGKTLIAAGSVNDGNSGSNYAVTFATAATGQITPLAITVTAASSTKTYDGTTSSTATPVIGGGSAVVTTLAGSAGQIGFSDGTGGAARFHYPYGLAVDSAGNVYVADANNDEIRKMTPSGVVATLAGSAGQTGSSDGTGSAARLYAPYGVAIDSAGNVYVADEGNDEIRKITPSGVVSTLAGSAGSIGSSNGTGSAARFYEPMGVAVDSAGNLYVAEYGNDEIRKITPSGVVTTLAGSAGQTGSSDGSGSAARFQGPTDVAVDSAGNVYVADQNNDEVRKITPSGVVTTLAGSVGNGSSDGTGAAARFYGPWAVALDSEGNVYVANVGNSEIREITPSGVVTTLAGSAGHAGSSDGTGSAARFYEPEGVAVNSAGNVYVADTGNDEIRLIGVISTASLVAGDTAAFTESFTTKNVGTGLTLTAAGSVNDGNGGSNYLVTFVACTTGQITARAVTVTAATSTKGYDGTTSATATPTITAGNLVSSDTAAFSEAFTTKNAASARTLAAAGSVNDGNGGRNYTVTFVADTTGQIAARAITVTAATSTKIYDGTTSSSVTPTITAGSLAGGDTAAFIETFDTRNVGNGKMLTVGGSVNDGNSGSNYTVTIVPNVTGSVTARAITVTAATSTKTYDGTTSSTATPIITVGALATGDTAAFSETFDTPNLGSGKTLTPAGSASDGNGGNNYTLTFAVNTTGAIVSGIITTTILSTSQPSTVYGTPVTFTATVSAQSGGTAPNAGSVDFFDATTSHDLGLGTLASSTGTVSTWTLTTGVKTFNVTTGDIITASYTPGVGFLNSSGTTTQTVTPLAITVTAATSTKTYDGTTSSTATPTIPSGSPGVVTTLAGSLGQTGSTDGTGSAATFDYPSGVAVDSAGNIYVADYYSQEVRKISPSGVVSTLAGYAGQTGSTDGAGSTARFDDPCGVAVDSAGNVYVADESNSEIRRITPSGVVTTLAGSAGQSGSSNGVGSAARFGHPEAVAVDSAGNVYVADNGNYEIREISPSGVVTTLAGSAGLAGSNDGTGSAARFSYVFGVAVNSAGNVYVGDDGNDEIRKISPSGVVTTLAGSAGQSGSTDGAASTARFNSPRGVAVDGVGNVYVGDYDNSEIRKIMTSGVVTTLAGTAGLTGSSDGTGSAARLNYPMGVAVDSSGHVYVADQHNQEIRQISGSTVALVSGDTATFTESFTTKNVGTGLTLRAAGSVNDGNGGSNYTVTFVACTTGQIAARAITVTAATSSKGYDGTTSATATPTITAGSLISGDSAAFSETFTTKNAGSGKTLAAAGSVNDGNGGSNYTVTFVSNTTGQIMARAITVTAATSTKIYDGTTSSSVTPTITAGSLASGDTAAFTEIFDTRNIGNGKMLTVGGSANDGNSGSNYTVTLVPSATGSITARAITVTAASSTKLYDGTTSSPATPLITAGTLATGDTAAFSETFDTPSLGTGKTLTPAGSVTDGNGGNNYALTFAVNTSGAIILSANNTTALVWPGPGSTASLTEIVAGDTPSVTISEPTAGVNLLKIDLGANYVFASGSTIVATGLTYQHAGSPSTSEYATIDISTAGNVSSLVATLPGDYLTLGQIRDTNGGVGSITATAGTIDVAGISTTSVNGNVSLAATANLTVAAGASILTGTGTISLSADVNANGTGDDGAGTLSISAGAVVDSTNTSASAITLRGAAVNIDTSTNPALVGGTRNSMSTTPTATLTGLSNPCALAFDANGNLYVANLGSSVSGTTVSEFAPGAATPTATLTGLTGPDALAFDASGNLYVANETNYFGTTVSEFAPGSTIPTATLTGLSNPYAMVFDASGNLYVANHNNSTVSEFAPGATTPTATLTGLFSPLALAFDASGDLFVCNANTMNTVSEFAPGATTPTATLTGLSNPYALVFDASGNLYVANAGADTVSKFAPGATTPTATLTGPGSPRALAFDAGGNLYVVNDAPNGSVNKFAPGNTTPTATLTGLNYPVAIVFDATGNAYAANYGNGTVSEFGTNAAPTAGGVVIRSSLATRPMSIGGTNNAVAGINLTDAELAQIFTTASGTVTFGDSSQTGNITFTTATPATTAGASTVVLQSPTGPGQIVLDDTGSGTGLSGNGGSVTLTAGTGGIVTPLNASGVPLASQGFNATGLTLSLSLNFAPTIGTQLMLISNTATPASSHPITGTFANLPQGGTISATYSGMAYWFQASYTGGDGNDLVLTAIGVATTTTVSTLQSSITYGTPATFTATVTAQSGSTPPSQGSVDFFDTTTGRDLGLGTFGSTSGLTSIWTCVTGVKTLNVTAGDTITATYTASTGFAGSSGTTTQTVMAIPITVTAVTSTKTYDGTTSSATMPTITGGALVAGDTSAFTETFDTRNVGSGKTLTAAGSVSDGNSGSNYTVTLVTNTGGSVAVRAITVTAVTSTKGYDGTTSTTATPTLTSGSLATGDTAAFSETFDTPALGTGKTLTPAGSASDGNGGNNYTVTFVVNTTGAIVTGIGTSTTLSTSQASVVYGTPVTFTVTVAAQSGGTAPTAGSVDFYDTTTNHDLGLGVFGGGIPATISSWWTLTTGVKTFNVTTGDIITASYIPGAGFLGSSGATTQTVTPLAITVTAATSTKTYDGTTSSTATPAIPFAGVVSTVAGSAGQGGSSNGTGSAARFYYPSNVAVDSAGNVYVADQYNDEIRKITPSGVVTTLAGSAQQMGSSDGTGSAARFFAPTGVAVDSAGNVYVADQSNDEIRKITPSGVVTTLAGSAQQMGSSDGTGSAARFYFPMGVAVDGAGNVYVADRANDEIREITPSGVVTTLAGSAGQTGSSDSTGSAARFYWPTGVAVDSAGNIYVADSDNDELRKISSSGVVTTLAGSATQTGSSDGTGSAARFYDPNGVALDATGNLYVADAKNDEIRKITPAGAVTTLAGSVGQIGSSGGTGSTARFDYPTGVAVDSAGNIYVADFYNDEARMISGGSTGLVVGDTAAFTESFNTRNAGTAKTISAAGSVNDGNGGSNYTVTFVANTTGSITAQAVTVTAATSTKSYDGTTSSAAAPTISGGTLATGDAAVFSESFTTKNAGSAKTLAAAGSVNDGNGGSNYTVTFVTNTTGQIAARAITVAAATSTKTYDGATSSATTPTITGGTLAVGDMAAFSETFDTKNVGTGKTLTAAGSVSDGNSGSNYTVIFIANTAGQIAARAIIVTAATSTKSYDGSTSSTATPTVTSGGLASGDTAVFSETFDTPAIGTGKTLTPAGSVSDGNGGNNYTVTFAVNTTGVIVAGILTTTTLSTSQASVVYGTSITFTATVSAQSGSTAPNAGSVDFYDTTTSHDLGLGALGSSAGTISTWTLVTGVKTFNVTAGDIITASYAPGSGFNASSGTTTQTITPLAITVTAASSTKGYDGTTSSTATPTITVQGPGVVTTLAGTTGQTGSNNGTGSAASFDYPTAVAVDSAGNVYVADQENDEIRKISPSGVVTTLAGAAGQTGSSDGTGSAARFYDPQGVAVDSAGNVYVADTFNQEIRKITPFGVVTTLAGYAHFGGSSDGTGSAARFADPSGVAVDSAGNVYVADWDNCEIREVSPSGVVTTLAGSAGQTGSSNGTGSAARFYYPNAVAVDGAGNTYVADEDNQEIRKISPSGVVTTLAGSAGQTGSTNGTGSAARFDDPLGVAVDDAGNVYVADNFNYEIREIAPSGVVTTLAGSAGQTGSSNGTGSTARFDQPWGVAVDTAGNVYVADVGNQEIRRISGNHPGIIAGDTAAFTETFNTKNVGTGLTLAAAGSVNDGNGGSNYTVTFLTNTTGQITARAITVTAASSSKGYDGGTSTSATPTVTGGSLATGDTAAFSETFDNRNAGTGKTLIAAGSVNDGDGGADYAVTFAANATGLVTTRAITVTAATTSKGYDGTTAGTATIAAGSLAAGDTAAFTESFDTRNVGSGKTLTAAGSVSDGNGGGNYAVSFLVSTAGVITPRPITVTAAPNSKFYDGTASAAAMPTISSGGLGTGDAAAFSETYDTPDPGTGKTLFAAGSVNDGNGGANYTVSFAVNTGGMISTSVATSTTLGTSQSSAVYGTPVNFTATVSAVVGSVAPSLGSVDFFDTTTNNDLGLGAFGSSVGAISTWTLTSSVKAFNVTTGDVITATYMAGSGFGGSSGTTTQAVTPLAITVTAAASTKVYDGTTWALDAPAIGGGSLVAGDTAAFSESFDTRNAGTGKTLTAAGSVNDGNGGNNYTLSFVANATGQLTPLAITVTAAAGSKGYDGTTFSAATPTITAGSLAAGDMGVFSETFDTRNAGTGKTLTAAGSVNDGNGGSNYAPTFVTNTTGSVAARAITVTAATGSKVYDGTTVAAAAPAITESVSTAAGSAGQSGSSDGTGSAARFFLPTGVATDSAGNVYVADTNDDEIRKISPAGVVTTLAGSAGQQGSSDGTGSAARFRYPGGLAVDAAGNVYVADTNDDEIRKISPSGVVTTLAGFAGQTGSSDGTGSAARFNLPEGVAVDGAGNVYVADYGSAEIRKISPSGVVTTLAGSAGQTGSSNGAGSAARFDYPSGVAVDGAGNVYVADYGNDAIRQITPSGVVSTLAGSAGQTGSSDGTGSAARFDLPYGVAVDGAGNVYVADYSNQEIRKITSGVVSTLAGSAGQTGSSNGAGSAARFDFPQGLAVDVAGDIYVADVENQEIRLLGGNLVAGDTPAFSESFDSKNAGTGKTLLAAGSVNDGNGGNNYTVTLVANTTGSVTARAITVTAASGSKVYDGTTSSAALPAITGGSLAVGDTPAFSETFDTRNAGTGKTLTAAGSVNDGNGGSNYTLTLLATNSTGSVTARAITVTAASGTKVYDGSTSSTVAPVITGGSLAAGDTAAFSETFDTKNVGSGKTLSVAGSVNDGNGGSNYTLTLLATNTTAAVTARAITVTATAGSKFYDGTTAATVAPTISGGTLVAGDTALFTETFDTRNAGVGKTLSAAGSVNDGNGGSNYTLSFVANAAGQITPLAVTVTAVASTKLYDGTTAAIVVPTISGGMLAAGDTAAFSETFDGRNVGSSKTLFAAGSVNDGSGGSNYTLSFVNNTIGQIAPRAITVTAAANSKLYDGTTSSTALPAITAGSLAAGDSAAFSESYSTKNVGTALTLTPADSISDGNGGSNYTLTLVPNTTGQITARPILVTAATSTKGYDGTTASAGTPTAITGELVSTLAGSPGQIGSRDGTGNVARFGDPGDVAVDSRATSMWPIQAMTTSARSPRPA